MSLLHPLIKRTTDGSFRKCWKKEDGEIYLYKRGISGAYNAGLEPYCEALASEIIHKADSTSVQYSVLKLHGEIYSLYSRWKKPKLVEKYKTLLTGI